MKEKKVQNNPPKPVLYGPDNPHPLSTIKTELVWDGKYDCHGNRREVNIAGAALPMQKIETVDNPRSCKEAQGLLFNSKDSHPDDFRIRLVRVTTSWLWPPYSRDSMGKIDLMEISL